MITEYGTVVLTHRVTDYLDAVAPRWRDAIHGDKRRIWVKQSLKEVAAIENAINDVAATAFMNGVELYEV